MSVPMETFKFPSKSPEKKPQKKRGSRCQRKCYIFKNLFLVMFICRRNNMSFWKHTVETTLTLSFHKSSLGTNYDMC